LTNFTGLNRRPSSTGRLFGLSPGEIAQAIAIATVDNVSLACMQVEPVSQWKGFSRGMTGMRAVYAVSLAKRGSPAQEVCSKAQRDWSKYSPNRSRWIGRIGSRCRKALALGSPLTRA
jgi:hypothetical protein